MVSILGTGGVLSNPLGTADHVLLREDLVLWIDTPRFRGSEEDLQGRHQQNPALLLEAAQHLRTPYFRGAGEVWVFEKDAGFTVTARA